MKALNLRPVTNVILLVLALKCALALANGLSDVVRGALAATTQFLSCFAIGVTLAATFGGPQGRKAMMRAIGALLRGAWACLKGCGWLLLALIGGLGKLKAFR